MYHNIYLLTILLNENKYLTTAMSVHKSRHVGVSGGYLDCRVGLEWVCEGAWVTQGPPQPLLGVGLLAHSAQGLL